MKAKFLFFSLLFLISCGSESEANESFKEDIEQTELSEHLPPRFTEDGLEDKSFSNEIYSMIDRFKTMVKEYEKAGFEKRVNADLNERYNILIDEMMNQPEKYDVSSENAAILHEYSHPLMELFVNIENASSQEEFKLNIKKTKQYLNSFLKLFPQ